MRRPAKPGRSGGRGRNRVSLPGQSGQSGQTPYGAGVGGGVFFLRRTGPAAEMDAGIMRGRAVEPGGLQGGMELTAAGALLLYHQARRRRGDKPSS